MAWVLLVLLLLFTEIRLEVKHKGKYIIWNGSKIRKKIFKKINGSDDY